MKELKKQTKGWLGIVGILLAVILALGITLGVATKWGKDVENLKPQKEADVTAQSGFEIEEEEFGSGISLTSSLISPAQYAEYGISPIAESAQSVKAKIEGDDTEGLKVVWTLSWKEGTSGKWGNGKDVSDYVTGSASSDTLTYNLSCSQPFGETIVLKAALEVDPSKSVTRNLQYKQSYGGNITGSLSYTNSSKSGANLTWGLNDDTVTVNFPGTVTSTTEFDSLYGASGSGTTTLSVKTELSQVYTIAAEVTDVKAEVSPTEQFRTAVTGAGGTMSTEAGSYALLGTGTGADASITTKVANVLLLTSVGSLNFNTLKSSLKALGETVTLLNIKLSATVNGQLQTRSIAIRFNAASFGSIGGSIGWTDDGGDVIFGG